jgi:hypothetical protein
MEINDGRYKYIAVLALAKKNKLVHQLFEIADISKESIRVEKFREEEYETTNEDDEGKD